MCLLSRVLEAHAKASQHSLDGRLGASMQHAAQAVTLMSPVPVLQQNMCPAWPLPVAPAEHGGARLATARLCAALHTSRLDTPHSREQRVEHWSVYL